MTFLKRAAAALLATTALAAVSSPSLAQDFKGKSAGDIVIRARGLAVLPQEDGKLKLNGATDIGEANVGNDYIPELDFSYFVTDNIALELIAGTSRHKVSGSLNGLGNSVDIGKVSLLPPTLTAQYHFFTKERVSPYIGAGINYTLFYREDAAKTPNGIGLAITNTDYENRFGFALQAGVDVAISGPWSLNFDVKKIFLKTDVTAQTNLGPVVKSKVHLDPWLVGVGIGYRF
ncbi:OmpW/AlkL family protein [Azospirillum rugosum]|uniref:Outer membrane protein n=1 Tax=Azospirillum rugosum TaxID=416170 RepID=A0ABS4SIW4_9PROT|nr:OmpW family outer membrane protein [Azospirillum rugosum]MBP2292498.1 outer membrane protein [Azospirillum rugosum]MDQ0526478.1 outer membrane protein [Azospirillum rugosum]